MKLRITLAVAAAALAGCAATPAPEPYNTREAMPPPGGGLFGDLRWNVDLTGNKQPVKVSEEEDFKRWKESNPSNAERREFEEWRAWQEWKRNNPK